MVLPMLKNQKIGSIYFVFMVILRIPIVWYAKLPKSDVD